MKYDGIGHKVASITCVIHRISKRSAEYAECDMYEQKIIVYGSKATPANVIVGWLVNDNGTKMTSAYIKEVK